MCEQSPSKDFLRYAMIIPLDEPFKFLSSISEFEIIFRFWCNCEVQLQDLMESELKWIQMRFRELFVSECEKKPRTNWKPRGRYSNRLLKSTKFHFHLVFSNFSPFYHKN